MTTRLRFGPFELDVQAAELRKGGTLIKLHGQPLRVLMLLAGRPGETLAREDIRREIWGEDTFVDFDQGLNFCIKQIRGHLNDDARTPQYVETLPRRGYRFIAPVEVLKDEAEGAAATASEIPPSPAPQPASRRRNGLMIGIAAAVTVIATVIYLAGWRPGAPLAARKTMLLVLPFDNLSGDSRQEYFSAGMTEEITTHLGRLDPQWLGVIARTSPSRSGSAGYAGRDIARMGRELGADYVVEGSVRLADNQVRITARLSRVREGTYIWVDSYDRSLSDVLALQGDVARDIARKVHVRLARSGSPLAAARPVRADVYDRYLRGRFFWNKRTRESMTKAVALFAEAVSLDPGYAAAYAGLADAYSALAHYGILPPREGYLKSKEAALKGLPIPTWRTRTRRWPR